MTVLFITYLIGIILTYGILNSSIYQVYKEFNKLDNTNVFKELPFSTVFVCIFSWLGLLSLIIVNIIYEKDTYLKFNNFNKNI